MFTVAPVAVATPIGEGNRTAFVAGSNLTTLTIVTEINDTGADSDVDFEVVLQRQGSDYKPKKTLKNILGL